MFLLLPYSLAEKTVMISSTLQAKSSSYVFCLSLSIIVSTPKCLAILINKSLQKRSNLSLCVIIILSTSLFNISLINLFKPFFLKFNPLPISFIVSVFSYFLFSTYSSNNLVCLDKSSLRFYSLFLFKKLDFCYFYLYLCIVFKKLNFMIIRNIETNLKNVGFDVIVFIPSNDEER